jgi:hypothetical protein
MLFQQHSRHKYTISDFKPWMEEQTLEFEQLSTFSFFLVCSTHASAPATCRCSLLLRFKQTKAAAG